MTTERLREEVEVTADNIFEEREVGDFTFIISSAGADTVQLSILDIEEDKAYVILERMEEATKKLKDGDVRDKAFKDLSYRYFTERTTQDCPIALREAIAQVSGNINVGLDIDTSEADAILEELIGAHGTYEVRR